VSPGEPDCGAYGSREPFASPKIESITAVGYADSALGDLAEAAIRAGLPEAEAWRTIGSAARTAAMR
jgi:hypothetical protein